VLIQEERQRECSGNCGQCVQGIGFLKQCCAAHVLGMTTVNNSRSCCNFFDGVSTSLMVSLFQLQTLLVDVLLVQLKVLSMIHCCLVLLEASSLINCFSL